MTDRIVAVLRAADGGYIPGPVLAMRPGCSPAYIGQRVADARRHYPHLTIHSDPRRGYRITGDVALAEPVPPEPAPAPASYPTPGGQHHLRADACDRLLARLLGAAGIFVRGAELADYAGIEIGQLSARMQMLARRRPDLVFEGKRGSGYRVAGTADVGALAAFTALRAPPPTPGLRPGPKAASVPLHRRMSANLAILDLLPAASAEMVKTIALAAGEDVDDTLHRLLSYGVEVHNDLVAAGENPVGLKRSTVGSQARPEIEQVWQ